MNLKILTFSIVFGGIITLLTGLMPNTERELIGATHYGYPFAWLIRRILAPQYFPWRINVLNLVANIVIWAAIVCIALLILKKKRKID